MRKKPYSRRSHTPEDRFEDRPLHQDVTLDPTRPSGLLQDLRQPLRSNQESAPAPATAFASSSARTPDVCGRVAPTMLAMVSCVRGCWRGHARGSFLALGHEVEEQPAEPNRDVLGHRAHQPFGDALQSPREQLVTASRISGLSRPT